MIVACAIRLANAGFGPKPKKRSRYIPAAVRRAVWERDGGRCTYVAPDGRRCESTHQLEFDHVDPHALGGEATIEKTRLRCKPHNLHWARQVFGEAHMDRFTKRGSREATGRASAVSDLPPGPRSAHGEAMPSLIRIYTRTLCPYSARARELLQRKGLDFEEIDLVQQPQRQDEMVEAAGGRTSVPQVFVGHLHLGGCDDLIALDDSGEFERLLSRSGAEASP